eukprot:TRINITY_DN1888_c0_g2_i1.p1 TRINITY_DN1888_c0_g2~~TRINITY_DN1888_c0_g2_i1.p1  ORF type:complete len:276 (-),score=37.78 TRINITY_DN1888_c0_g2_i1:58-885(-)
MNHIAKIKNKFRTTKGYNLYYEVSGNTHTQSTVLLFHNATGCCKDWVKQIPMLLEHDYAVINYDRFGFGNSDFDVATSIDFDMYDDCASDAVELLQHLGINKCSLVGHSDGSAVAFYTASLLYTQHNNPEVESFIAIAPHMYHKGDQTTNGIDDFFDPNINKTLDRFLKSHYKNHGKNAEGVLKRWRSLWTTGPHEKQRIWDAMHILDNVRVPTLIIQGSADPYFPMEHVRDINNRLVDSELIVLDGLEHNPHREDALSVNDIMIKFLKQRSPKL